MAAMWAGVNGEQALHQIELACARKATRGCYSEFCNVFARKLNPFVSTFETVGNVSVTEIDPIVEPEPAARPLLLGYFKPLSAHPISASNSENR
jgi:hypothetical protein